MGRENPPCGRVKMHEERTLLGWIEGKSMNRRENRGQEQGMASKKPREDKSSRSRDLPTASSDGVELSGGRSIPKTPD